MIESIAFVSRHYPTPWHPYDGVFLQQVVDEARRAGRHCTVVNPLPIHRWAKNLSALRDERREVSVIPERPRYVAFSNRRVGPWSTGALTQAMFQRATLRVLRRMEPPADLVYGHFLYPGGRAAIWCGRCLGLPSFVAVGESVENRDSSLWSVKSRGYERARGDLRNASGFIAVSTMLKEILVEDLGVSVDRVIVLPNAADTRVFYPRPKDEMRRRWGLPPDAFVTAFVGGFGARKGADRVMDAIRDLPGVVGVFAGKGSAARPASNSINLGVVPHDRIPEVLSCADVFVAPSLAEGSSNTVAEAIACGLPIICARRRFNEDLVTEDTAYLVDPVRVDEIRTAITELQNDPVKARRMSSCALAHASRYDLTIRVRRILSFLEERVERDREERRVSNRG